jgi:hypothetical protein
MYIDSKGRETVVICVCPIKNEAWILQRFLTLASEWADYIVVGDQDSTDGSKEIIKSFNKTIYLHYEDNGFNEVIFRQKCLNEVKSIKAQKKLVFCLDADEALTFNWCKSDDWKTMLEAEPNTVFNFNWINLLHKNKETALIYPNREYAYIDDGLSSYTEYKEIIHIPRIPHIKNPEIIKIAEIGFLHFMYLVPNRCIQKQAWYQCWEQLKYPKKRAKDIFRMYNRDLGFSQNLIRPINKEWIESTNYNGDIFMLNDTEVIWRGEELLQFFQKYGAKKFSKLYIWNYDWVAAGELLDIENPKSFKDPRNMVEKNIHKWLAKTQHRQHSFDVRLIQKLIQTIGW